MPVVVTLNQFITDTDKGIFICKKRHCEEKGCNLPQLKCGLKGGEDGLELAKKSNGYLVCKRESNFKPIYEDTLSITEKNRKNCQKEIYGADSVEYSRCCKK